MGAVGAGEGDAPESPGVADVGGSPLASYRTPSRALCRRGGRSLRSHTRRNTGTGGTRSLPSDGLGHAVSWTGFLRELWRREQRRRGVNSPRGTDIHFIRARNALRENRGPGVAVALPREKPGLWPTPAAAPPPACGAVCPSPGSAAAAALPPAAARTRPPSK